MLAAVAPSSEEIVYAASDRGFALHSMRRPSLTRLYLQVDPDEPVERWPDGRIWEELQARLATDDGWTLDEGEILDKGVTGMRSFVVEPMRFGRLFLAGDAAHIVPPTGAKGMNLAVADVRVLAEALAAWYRTGDTGLLDAWSSTCLRRVWRAQDFSTWMTGCCCTAPRRRRLPAGSSGPPRLPGHLRGGRPQPGRELRRPGTGLTDQATGDHRWPGAVPCGPTVASD